MSWYSVFYFFSVADRLGMFFGWMVTIFTAITVFSWLGYFIHKGSDSTPSEDNDLKVIRKWIWYSTIPFIFFWLAYLATPSKKDMLLIIAGGAVGEFVTNDASAKELPADITRFLHAEILKATSEVGDNKEPNPEVEKIKKMSKEQLEQLVLEQLGKKDSLKISK